MYCTVHNWKFEGYIVYLCMFYALIGFIMLLFQVPKVDARFTEAKR